MISKKVRTAAALMAVASISVANAQELGPHTSTTIAMERDQGVRTIQVGAATVFALYDGSVPLKAADLLKGESPDTIRAQLRAAGEKEEVVTSINAYLIRTGKRLVLVDTGAGSLFGPNGGSLITRLRYAGYGPGDVTDVLITHIHTDHSGGLAKDGKSVFPNALIHVSKEDFRFFFEPGNLPSDIPVRFHDEAVAALQPYVDQGQVRTFSRPAQILPGIRVIPARGHTPGHSIYELSSKKETIEFLGDIVHVGAVQLPHPEVTITFDVDQSKAQQQRLAQFHRLANDKKLIAAAHLPFPGMGYLNRSNNGFAFTPAQVRGLEH